jgi:hypothetical protein
VRGWISAFAQILEVWTLQNLCDASILLLFVALALVAGRGYLEEIRFECPSPGGLRRPGSAK